MPTNFSLLVGIHVLTLMITGVSTMTSIILNGIKSGELSKNMAYQYAIQVTDNGGKVTMWTDQVLCITSKGK